MAPNILSITHWERLLGGELYAPLSRVDWATLLRRTFDVNVLLCRGGGRRMTVRAVVTDAAAIAMVLGALRRSAELRFSTLPALRAACSHGAVALLCARGAYAVRGARATRWRADIGV